MSRPRPPIAARNCGSLTTTETREASAYLNKISRFAVLYHEDASDALQQRDIVGEPGRPIGVILYLPAERGMNRAYLERLLSCHAVRPPHPEEHPNDPLLSAGIVFVDVKEAGGGEYQIRIMADSRAQATKMLQRARALGGTGSVEIRQLESVDGPQ